MYLSLQGRETQIQLMVSTFPAHLSHNTETITVPVNSFQLSNPHPINIITMNICSNY
jgi:hypothetical protein